MYDIPWILLRGVEELSAGVEWNLPASAGFNELSWFDLCLFLFFYFGERRSILGISTEFSVRFRTVPCGEFLSARGQE